MALRQASVPSPSLSLHSYPLRRRRHHEDISLILILLLRHLRCPSLRPLVILCISAPISIIASMHPHRRMRSTLRLTAATTRSRQRRPYHFPLHRPHPQRQRLRLLSSPNLQHLQQPPSHTHFLPLSEHLHLLHNLSLSLTTLPLPTTQSHLPNPFPNPSPDPSPDPFSVRDPDPHPLQP